MAEEIFPPAFAQQMQTQLRQNWKAFLAVHEEHPPTSIRINPLKNNSKDLERVPWTDFGYYLEQRPSFTFDPLFHGGAYYVQEASSMFLEQALTQTVDLSQPLTVLDLCAAPGGKSTHLLSLMNGQSLLVSNETIRSRATVLGENIQKWGSNNAVVTNNDPEDFKRLEGFFDVIVVDAPCSGEGLFRKDPNAMREWSEEHVALCVSRQQRILSHVWPSLKKNGILIYCTCTYNERENEENLKWLAKERKVESLRLHLPVRQTGAESWGVEEVNVNGIFGYRFYPHLVKGEGFFISVIRKNEEQREISIHRKKTFDHPPAKIKARLTDWFQQPDEIEFIKHEELILALPRNYSFEIEFLSKFLRVIQKGTAIATAKHDKLIPEHAFALSAKINGGNFHSIELSLHDAIAYLRKDVLNLTSGKTGFTLMSFQHLPIGWANLLENRMNNLYPSAWRIRSDYHPSLEG
jgi:16S rRNA C967 or C1407 C5-methylase (RsmB/RsmF family)/NOL1/NOP2/fmu family ribosome biogenesis protein